jgi:SEC-C motif-containing protein
MLRALMDIPFHEPEALEAFARPLIDGKVAPKTAAELMASRYVAYATGAIDYLIATHSPDTRHNVDRTATEQWSKQAEWQGLEIVRTEKGGEADSTGEVEFIARYRRDGTDHVHHERSQFKRVDGRWFFVDGQRVGHAPVVRSGPKIGRNDACPCGSGKKYKKCCGK